MSALPKFIDPLPDVPMFLKTKRQWVLWKLEVVNGKPTKVPYQVNGRKASSTDPNTWTDYLTAVTGATINSEQGIGFVVDGGIIGFDFDNCRDPKTGEIKPWAIEIIDALDAYTEITPSLTGLRVWVQGAMVGKDKVFNLDPAIGAGTSKVTKVEVYTDSRYFTITGNAYFDVAGDVEDRDLTEVFRMLHELRGKHPSIKSTDPKVATADVGEGKQVVYEPGANVKTSKYSIFMRGTISSDNGFRITLGAASLTYESQSEADMGFCTVLAVVHDSDTEKMDADFRQSALYRPKWERDDYRENTIQKAVKSAERFRKEPQPAATDAATDTATTPSPFVLPRSVLTSSYLGQLYDEVFAPNGWCLELALPALVTAASVLIPKPEGAQLHDMLTSTYTALIAPVHGGKSQVEEWSSRSLGIYHSSRDKHYTRVKFGSAEQMWKYLHKHSKMEKPQDPNAFTNAVLINPDELSHVMAKAGIPDASFSSTLTSAFYSRSHIVTLGGTGGGKDVAIPFPFSIIGGVVKDDFDSVFGSSALGGLYDRFLFGLPPDDFHWSYRPFPWDHPFLRVTPPKPVAPRAHQSLQVAIQRWNDRDRDLGRIVEVCVRVATIFAGIDGRDEVTGDDLDALWPLALYQKAIRGLYKPNAGTNPDAIFSNVALNWVAQHAKGWRTVRDLQTGTNYYRRKLGPNVAFRALQGLAASGEVDMWTSRLVDKDGKMELNDVPPGYTGKRPKLGGGLVKAAHHE